MARFRIYPSANSVIFEDDIDRNVGINPVFELWYGQSGVTRSVFAWDWQYYMDFYDDGIAPALTASSITSFGITLKTTFPILQSGLSVGFAAYEMECPDDGDIADDFDEGIGWHHEGPGIFTGYCNWINIDQTTQWPSSGAAPNGTLTGLTEAERDAKELFFTPASMSEAAAKVWSGHVVPNEKLVTVLKFTEEYEALTGSTAKKRLFHSRHTNTVYLPYCEVVWDDHIAENRMDVIEDVSTPLYLFIYSGGTLADPESVDSVTINDVSGTNITKVSKGIYKYEYVLPTGSGGTGTVITDTWSITYTGSLTGSIIQTFTGVSIANSTLWSGDTALPGQPYAVSIPNLAAEYSKNDIIYVRCKFRREFESGYDLVKNAQFRVHIPNGDTGEPQLIMYDWSPISYRGDDNFFIMFLSWFLTGQTYQVDVRYGDGQNKIIDKQERKFKVTL
jgi:hypothetical protein